MRALALALALALASCVRPPTPSQAAALASELAAKELADRDCLLTSSTCAGYVACRTRVAASHGLRFAGRCSP